MSIAMRIPCRQRLSYLCGALMAAGASDSLQAPFRWRNTTVVQRRTLLAAALGWMLDAFDVMLYSIVLATLDARIQHG